MGEYFLIFVGGLLGSAHCIGMCGGFVLLLGSRQRTVAHALGRQVLYATGRIFVYASLGLMAGFAGAALAHHSTAFLNGQAILSLLAGVLLICVGLFATGLVPQPFHKGHACSGGSAFRALLQARDWSAVLAAGILNGFLPCGLVYAYLALASSTGSMFQGGLTMLLFGLGTLPALLVTGLTGSWLSVTQRQRLFQVAAWCLIATGIIACWRGVTGLSLSAEAEAPGCPLCGPQ